MKTYKVDFSRGINVVTEKRLMPEGYIVLADNIDLRSGSMHPFKFPEPYIGISGGIPSGTTCIWEFKNNWFFSALYRAYTGEYVNSQTRVYFCESLIAPAGTYVTSHLIPQKVVNGVQAQLGTPVPLVPPTITATTSDTPATFLATVLTTGGYLGTGQYSYRISAIINGQVMPPSGAVIVNIPQSGGVNITTGTINLTWTPVALATGYVVFGRILGSEQTLFTLGAGAVAVTDSGSNSPSGAYAVNYQPLNPITYVYTYTRDVGTMPDESGPSPISNTTSSSFVRTITRNPNADGFYATSTQYSGLTLGSSNIFPNYTILGITYTGADAVLSLGLTAFNSPWWVNGMKLVFANDPTATPYAFSIPTALVNPTTPALVLNSATGGAIPAGTYQYAICAVRGTVTGITGYPATLPITTAVSPSLIVVTAGSTSAVTISWAGVNGATGYVIVRYNGTVYQVVGIIQGQTAVFTDINDYASNSYPTIAEFPASNQTGIIYNPINTSAPISWENPSAASMGQIIVMSEAVPASAGMTTLPSAIYLAASPFVGVSPVSATTAPTLAVVGGAAFSAGTYYIMVQALNGTTIISDSAYAPITLGGVSNIQVTFPSIPGATSYKIYYYQLNVEGNYLAGTFTTSPATLSSAGAIIIGTPGWAGVDQDVINITSAQYNNMIGVATYYQDSLSLFTVPNFLNIYTPTQSPQYTPVTIGSLYDVPNNGYYKYWNIYRAGDAGATFNLVSQQPITVTSYTDTVGVTGLGLSIPTFYNDVVTGGVVSFQPPPPNGYCPQLYNGMLFMIDGNTVRWTPTSEPDAWPGIYVQSFAFPPQAILAYGGGIYVFCENGVYRLDGFLPGQISMTQLMASGCIAPYSPRVLGEHIIYLAKRGLMMIHGMTASSITERFIPYRLMTEPSAFIGGITAQNFWWFTTDHTSAYGALLDIGMNPIPAADGFGLVTAKDKPLTSLIYEARSFVWQNKYYLYFVNSPTNEFQGNPCWCVDLGIAQLAFVLPNYPITTLGFKPTDMHVSSTGECYALLTIDPYNDPSNQTNLAISESQFNASFTAQISVSTQAIYRFNPTFGQNVPMRWRTSEVTAGAPSMRKRWREVRLNGSGTHQIRVFIDGALQTMATGATATTLTLSESPIHPSRILLPPGSWGFSCSVEGCGDGVVRVIELGFDPMAGEDKQGEGKE